MEHVVFFPSSDGAPAFRRLSSFEEAVRLVEHLRNVENVEHVSVHALTEVPLAFRAYYRVEVPAPAGFDGGPVPTPELPAPGAPAPVAPAASEAEPVAVQPEGAPPLALVEALPVQAGEPEPALSASNGNSHDGRGSLGFFA